MGLKVAASDVPLSGMLALFCGIFIIGMALVLPLFKFNYYKFVHSKLFIKIILWIPIFAVFVAALYMGDTARLVLLAAIVIAASSELVRVARQKPDKKLLYIYLLFFIFGMAHLCLLARDYPQKFTGLLVVLGFATVLSDVLAFFMGNYGGRHKLPRWINPDKSWEGVAGQIIGALIGVLLVGLVVMPIGTAWLFLPVGLGSAAGDLANSLTKRKAGIKDWGQSIPGHGGFLDRFSSIAGSVLFTYYYLKWFV
jgi:phosphatidate cytidylyltransferase